MSYLEESQVVKVSWDYSNSWDKMSLTWKNNFTKISLCICSQAAWLL